MTYTVRNDPRQFDLFRDFAGNASALSADRKRAAGSFMRAYALTLQFAGSRATRVADPTNGPALADAPQQKKTAASGEDSEAAANRPGGTGNPTDRGKR